MKKNHLLLLLAVAIIVGLVALYFQTTKYAGWNDSKTDRTIFQKLAVNDITKIQIRSAPASVTLEKKGDQWGVAERADYPADFTKIRDLTKTLWGLEAGQETQVGPSQLGRLKLIEPGQGADSGIEINLLGDKEIASLIIGKAVDQTNAVTGSAAAGRFVYNPAREDRVYLVSESFLSVDPVTVGSWLDKTFVAPGEIKEIDQAAWSNNPGWKIIRQDAKADWQLEDPQSGESLDKAFAGSFSTFAPTIVDVRPQSVSPDETGLSDPFKVTVKTFDGFTYAFLVGKEGPDKARYLQLSVSANLPSAQTPKPNGSAETKKKQDEEFDLKTKTLKERLENEKKFEKWIFLVPDWNLEQMLKRRDEILSKATPSPSPVAAPIPELPSAALPTPIASPFPQPSPSPTPEGSPSASPTPPSSTPSPSPAAGS